MQLENLCLLANNRACEDRILGGSSRVNHNERFPPWSGPRGLELVHRTGSEQRRVVAVSLSRREWKAE